MAAKAYDYVRYTLYGTILGVQTWSINFALQPSAISVSNAQLATFLAATDTAAQAWWTAAGGIKTLNTSQVKYIGVRGGYYPAGSTVAAAAADHPFSAALLGNSSSAFNPTQTSCVASLITDTAGRNNRGRVYIPATGAALDSNFKLPTTYVDNAAVATATLLGALQLISLAGSAVNPIVAGSVTSPAGIVEVRADNECDIQRRRADKIAATYTKTGVV